MPTLADAGIDKHLADRARKYAAIPEGEFEDILSQRRDRIAQENEPISLDLTCEGANAQRKQDMAEIAATIHDRITCAM